MKMRKLGKDLKVRVIGLRCIGLSFGLGPATDRKEAVAGIRSAVDRGVMLYDTAGGYEQHRHQGRSAFDGPGCDD